MPKPSAGRKRGDQERQPGREDRYEWIRIEDILLPKSDETLDEKTVAVIAESILVFDLLQPIGVRRVTEKRKDGETTEKIALAFGAHRLEAMKRLGRKEIPCFYVEGNETDAQLVRLGENLWRKRTSVLRDAERLVEYFKFASAKLSGQPVRKSKFGHPPGGTALAARELPVIGRSVEAGRQIIRRAKKIAQISPEAKKAAIKARLQNNQQALLKIAKAGGQKAQLRMVAELAEISKELRAPRNRAAKRSRAEGETSTAATVRSSLQAGADEIAADADDAPAEETGTSPPIPKTTTTPERSALRISPQT